MSTFDTIAEKIIKEQELVIGPMAWSEAVKVPGLVANMQNGSVTIGSSDPKTTIDQLVAQYERLFGRASHEVCKEAAATIIAGLPKIDIPLSLVS